MGKRRNENFGEENFEDDCEMPDLDELEASLNQKDLEDLKEKAEFEGENEIEIIIAQSSFLIMSLTSAIDSFVRSLPIRAGQFLINKKDPVINKGWQLMKDKNVAIEELAQEIVKGREYIRRAIICMLTKNKESFEKEWPTSVAENNCDFIWNLVEWKFRGQSNPYVAPLETELRCLAANSGTDS